jgi:hypothetical protein
VRLDPTHWSERSQGAALLAVTALYFAAAVVGPDGGPVVKTWYAAALGIFGGLVWRYRAMPWRDIASWTIPLVAWMAAAVIIAPGPILAFVALALAGGWLGLFACWTPFVPWWYRSVLHKPLSPAEDVAADDIDER